MSKRVFTQTFGVAGALIERDEKYLLVQEAHNSTGEAGQWNHPAGWIEVGEDPRKTAVREVKEETGYDFEPTHVLGIYSLVKKENKDKTGDIQHSLKIIFTGFVSGGAAQTEGDVVDAKWFTSSDIEQMDITTLRDMDIKKMINDYTELERYPLGVLEHTITE